MPAILLAVLVSGCASVGQTVNSAVDMLNPFSSSSKVKIPELTPVTATAQLAANWQASVGASGESVFTPAVVGTRVYAVARDGTLARFDDGRQVWRISAGQVVSGGVGADDKLVVVGTPKGAVLAFDAETGREAWKAQVSSEVLAAPAVGDGLVVVRSGDSRLFGFEAVDGKRRWVYQRSTPALSLRSNVGVVLAGRAVLAGFPGGKLVAVAAANGAALWEVTVAQPKGATELERVADITSSPVIDGREVCAVAYQGRVACFDMINGNQTWARDMSSSAGVDMDAKSVYVSDEKGVLHALDRANGASLWKQDKLSMRGLSRPVALGSFVAVADSLGIVHLLKKEDGAFAARFTTDGSAVSAEPQRIGTRGTNFLVQTRNGGVYSLSSR